MNEWRIKAEILVIQMHHEVKTQDPVMEIEIAKVNETIRLLLFRYWCKVQIEVLQGFLAI